MLMMRTSARVYERPLDEWASRQDPDTSPHLVRWTHVSVELVVGPVRKRLAHSVRSDASGADPDRCDEGSPRICRARRRLTSWQGGFAWLLIAPGLVIVYLSLAFVTSLLLGAEISSTAHLATAGGTILTLVLLGGWWEEPG